jgi:site-specific recombinase XerD
MSHKTYIRTLLKNINEKGYGCINLEIAFTHKENKKKTRRYVNTGQYLHKNDYGKNGIKTNRSDLKSLIHLIDLKKQETANLLRNLEIDNQGISPDIYDQAIKIGEDKRKDIFELYDMFLVHKKKTKDYRTYQKFDTIKTALTEFIEQSKYTKIYSSDINVKFLNEFYSYIAEDRDLSTDTLNKYQSGFNTFMDYITNDLKINNNVAYKDFVKVPRSRESESKVVLLKEHVGKIVKWKPSNDRYSKVKDLFLFQVFTGVRYSDLIRIKKSFVKNDQLSFIMFKTHRRVNIPLHPAAKRILLKYDYQIGEQAKALKNYNIDIKTVCREAGLKEEVSTLRLKLTSKIASDTPLCELVSSHVGRTTFVTNCLIAGISPFIVKSYTGHTEIETLKYYMKLAGNTSQDAFQKFQQYLNFR